MRPLFSIFVLMVVLTSFNSCQDDDGESDNNPVENKFTYNGKDYKINDAVLKYWGELDFTNDNQENFTHYYYWMIFSDGTITLSSGNMSVTNATYFVPVMLATTISGHGPSFEGGNFPSVLPSDYFGRKAPVDKNFFTTFLFRFDINNDMAFDATDLFVDASDGEFTVDGQGDAFKVVFNTMTTGEGASGTELKGVSIKGVYDGPFRVMQ